jgi:hypothetical protein
MLGWLCPKCCEAWNELIKEAKNLGIGRTSKTGESSDGDLSPPSISRSVIIAGEYL